MDIILIIFGLAMPYLKLKQLFCILIFLFNLNVLIAQGSSQVHLQLKVHPLAVINVLRPTLQASIELRMRNRFGAEFTYGYQYIYRMNTDTITIPHPKGQTIKLDLKWYLKNKEVVSKANNRVLEYVGLGFWYVEESGNAVASFTNECYGFHVKNRIVAFNYGAVIDYKHFSLEFITNLGIRFKERTFVGKDTEADYTDDVASGFFITHSYSYKGALPHIGLGIRFGWKVF